MKSSVKSEICLKIFDYFVDNNDKEKTIESIALDLGLSSVEVERCFKTLPSYFTQNENTQSFSLNKAEDINRDSLIKLLKSKTAKKVGLLFWFLIFFTIGISLMTVIISKG